MTTRSLRPRHLAARHLAMLPPIAALSFAACSGATTGDEQNQTSVPRETVRFDLAGDLAVVGETTADAEPAIARACERWTVLVTELARPATVEHVDCGEPQPIDLEGGQLWRSHVVATIAAELPVGITPTTFSAGPIAKELRGAIAATSQGAIDAWWEACASFLRNVKGVYGDRLLGASCGDVWPWSIGGTDERGWGYASQPSFAVQPAETSDTTGIRVEGVTWTTEADESDAAKSFATSCIAWITRMASQYGADRIGKFDCETESAAAGPVDGPPTLVARAPAIDVALLLEPGTQPSSEETTVTGIGDTLGRAAADALARCDETIEARRTTLGTTFLGGSCSKIGIDDATSEKRVSVVATVWTGVLAAAVDPKPTDPTPVLPTGPDATLSSPADRCSERCATLFASCSDLWFPEDICATDVCGAETVTEGELRCAEATPCEHVDNWWSVCGF